MFWYLLPFFPFIIKLYFGKSSIKYPTSIFKSGFFLYISLANILALKFISGRTKLLKPINGIAINIEKIIPGNKILIKLMPDDLRAVNSLSSANLPYDINVAINIAIGVAKANIQPKFINRYSKIIFNEIPFPKNLSTALSKKLVNKRNTTINNE